MALFNDLFYSGPMLAVFSDEARLRRMLEFEAALALAEAACGLIPENSAKAIAVECRIEKLSVHAIRAEAAKTGTPALPLIAQVTELVRQRDAEAAGYVHWGATSQDAIDTGFMMQAREALDLIADATDSLCLELATLAERHAGTVMAGRTWLQQAVPVTFGWKAAGWLDAMLRHRARLGEVRERALALQFGGAAGTLASLGADGWKVSEKFASLLGLAHCDVSWHASRDRVGEIATTLGLITATLGKIAKDISLLMQTEVAEAFEPSGAGRGASSTMPQKRNPVACAAILAASVRVPGLIATVLSAAVQEQERGLGNWPAEWETVPEIFNLCAGALDRATEVISGLEVDGERMRANLDSTGGLIMAEAVTMALAGHIGKAAAHGLITRACERAVKEKSTLRKALLRRRRVFGADDGRRTRLGSRSQQLSRIDAHGDRQGASKSVSRSVAGEPGVRPTSRSSRSLSLGRPGRQAGPAVFKWPGHRPDGVGRADCRILGQIPSVALRPARSWKIFCPSTSVFALNNSGAMLSRCSIAWGSDAAISADCPWAG